MISWTLLKIDPALAPTNAGTSPRFLASGKPALDVRRGR
jgi:hypothetical protein